MNAGDRRWHDLLTEYALGSLEAEDVAGVEAYLASSSEGRAELRAIRAALVEMTEALPQHAPSGSTWEGLEAAFLAETQAERTQPQAGGVKVPQGAPDRRRLRGPSRPGRPFTPRYGWLAAACFALLSVGLATWGTQSLRSQQAMALSQQQLAEFLAAPTMQKVALYGAVAEEGQEVGLGSVLLLGERALVVLSERLAPGLAYQAWGHDSNDWTPGGDQRLTSLVVSSDPVFEVATGSFAAMYLSAEPRGGSDQPTRPIARLSLLDPVADRPLVVLQPQPGSVVAGGTIVHGLVDGSVNALSYRLGDGEAIELRVAGNRFSFTVPALPAGSSSLVITATLRDGSSLSESLWLTGP